MKLKKSIQWVASSLMGTALNFGIFLFAYNKLTFPFIHEEQRVENAPYIFQYVLPAMIASTLLTLIVFYLLKCNKS